MLKDNRLLALLVVVASAPKMEDGAELIKLAQEALAQYGNCESLDDLNNYLIGHALKLAGALDKRLPEEHRVALLKEIFLPIFDMNEGSSNEGN